jgi:hypothetical protein
MKEIQITLYEIFGYLVPGFVFAGSISMGYWTVFEKNDLVISKIEAPFWFLIVMISYLAGHVTQSIANIILGQRSTARLCFRNGKKGIGDHLIEASKDLTMEIIKPGVSGRPDHTTILEVCDAMIEHRGSPQTREVYLYREGFYRGMWVALAFLSLVLLWRSFLEKSVFKFEGFSHNFTSWEMLVLAAISGIVGILFFFRFRRFGKYLITHKVASALVLKHLNKE